MFKKKDPNSFTKYFNLFDGTNQIGYLIGDYHVIPYDDVEVKDTLSFAPTNKKKFMLHCTQRIVIYNSNFQTISPISITPDPYYPYENYPALINTTINTQPSAPSGVSLQLLDYSPKTINTKVQSSGSTGIGSSAGQSSSISNTVGSSTSQTNSYGTSVGVDAGIMGDVFSFGENASETSEHSTTTSTDQSQSTGSGNSSNQSSDQSNSDTMSMKDWGAYAIVNPANQQPSWFFGQEYPWDAIVCRLTDGATNPNTANPNYAMQLHLILPSDMQNRLFDNPILYPPSQLSMFGFNFVMKSVWMVSVDYSQSDANSDITVTHNINYYSASHSVSGSTAAVYLDKQPVPLQWDQNNGNISTDMNLLIMALDVLGSINKPSIVGFVPNKFIILPAPATATASAGAFEIVSAGNNLLIKDTTDPLPAANDIGAGFACSETTLAAGFSQNCTSLQMTIYFKVIDVVNNYSMFMKHWKTGTTGVMLTIVINGDTTNAITKYVDALEAEGGENNLLTLDLRNQDYASINYHDYLQLGLNVVQITITPINPAQFTDCGYQIRAISIEKS
jgi:hypothetical protein